jgi:hypothetical protein
MMEISDAYGAYPFQALKENSPTSGPLRILVARGGIEPEPKMPDPILGNIG